MKQNKQKKKTPLNIIILNCVIVLLIIIFIPFILVFLEELKYSGHYQYEENSFAYRLQDERYGDMVEYYHDNVAYDSKASQTMSEYYAVAEYYEAALYYKAFSQNGDTARAEKYLKKMEAAGKKLGMLSATGESIKKELGLR